MEPARQKVIGELASFFNQKGAIYYNLPPMVFLCGKAITESSSARRLLLEIIREKPLGIVPVIADEIWKGVNKAIENDALKMEEYIGNLCHAIVLFPESPGSIAELGAFSVLPTLNKKTLALKSSQYLEDNSFINHGPYQWLKRESHFQNHDRHEWDCDFEDKDDIRSVIMPFLEQISVGRAVWSKMEFAQEDHRGLFVLMLLIIAIFCPIKLGDVVKCMSELIKIKITKTVNVYAQVAVGLGIVEKSIEGYQIKREAFDAMGIRIYGC